MDTESVTQVLFILPGTPFNENQRKTTGAMGHY